MPERDEALDCRRVEVESCVVRYAYRTPLACFNSGDDLGHLVCVHNLTSIHYKWKDEIRRRHRTTWLGCSLTHTSTLERTAQNQITRL